MVASHSAQASNPDTNRKYFCFIQTIDKSFVEPVTFMSCNLYIAILCSGIGVGSVYHLVSICISKFILDIKKLIKFPLPFQATG